MESMEYKYIQYGFAVLTLLCIFLFLFGFKKVIAWSDYPEAKKKKIWNITLMGIISWLLIVTLLAVTGVTRNFSMPPRLMLIIVPPLFFSIYFIFTDKADRLLVVTPQSWLIGFQMFRIPVEILLWGLFAINLLPLQMTFEGYNWDILTGITASLFLFLRYKVRWSEWTLAVWNIFGLLLLINIVTIAILSMPVPFRVFMNEPANTIVAYFPIVFLPAILVPFAYYMHFFSLRKWYVETKKR